MNNSAGSYPNNKKPLGRRINGASVNETVSISSTALEKEPLMVCHYLIGDEWNTKEFTSRKTRYSIGSSSRDSEIGISEPDAERIQAIVQKVGGIWFVMEYARTNLMCVNGIPDFQYTFNGSGCCYLRIGNSRLVLNNGNTHLQVTKTVKPEHSFTITQGDTNKTFSTLAPCLIGKDSACDFSLNMSMVKDNLDPVLKEPFVAMVNTYKNQLFIDSISGKYPVKINGRTITDPTPICAGTKFNIGEIEFLISESTTIPHAGDFMDLSEAPKKRFMLLHVVRENTEKVINIELPRPGQSVTIGRGDDVTFTIHDPVISSQHLQLIIYEKSVLAADLESTNGTYVNDEKIKKKLMHAGDFITIGGYTFFLCYKD